MNTEEHKSAGPVRVRRSRGERAALVKSYEASGLTKIAFCRREGLNVQNFYRWCSKHKRAQPVFAEVTIPPPRSADIEICLSNGTRVMIRHNDQPAELAALIRGISGC